MLGVVTQWIFFFAFFEIIGKINVFRDDIRHYKKCNALLELRPLIRELLSKSLPTYIPKMGKLNLLILRVEDKIFKTLKCTSIENFGLSMHVGG